jgi:hypothetical protein
MFRSGCLILKIKPPAGTLPSTNIPRPAPVKRDGGALRGTSELAHLEIVENGTSGAWSGAGLLLEVLVEVGWFEGTSSDKLVLPRLCNRPARCLACTCYEPITCVVEMY